MKDALLQQIEALISDPIPLLNLPESDRLEWEDRLFTLAELLEDFRSGVLAKDLPPGFSRYSSQDYLKTPEDVRAYAQHIGWVNRARIGNPNTSLLSDLKYRALVEDPDDYVPVYLQPQSGLVDNAIIKMMEK